MDDNPFSGIGKPVGQTARSLPALVADRIAASIRDGTLPPGTRLPEVSLADAHAVSRATVREALAMLERLNMVQRIPRIGAQVATVMSDEIEEISELRGVLLGLAARRAIRSGNSAAIQAFFKSVGELERLVRTGRCTPQEFAAAAARTQSRLIDIGQGRWIDRMYAQLSDLTPWNPLVRRPATSFAAPERRRESAANWRGIADAIRARDVDAAEAWSRRLLADASRSVQEQLNSHHTGR